MFIGLDENPSIATIVAREGAKGTDVFKYKYDVDGVSYKGQFTIPNETLRLGTQIWIRHSDIIPSIASHRFSINIFKQRLFLLEDSITLYGEFYPDRLNSK